MASNLPDVDLENTKIFGLVKKRNNKVLLTAIIVLLIGFYILSACVAGSSSWGILISLAIIGCSCYGFYLYYTRTINPLMHPDVRKFLSFTDSEKYIKLFEEEINSPDSKFSNAYITNHFVVHESFYRFRWIYFTEIVWAYRKQTKHSVNFIPTGTSYSVIIHLSNGKQMEIESGRDESTNFLNALYRIAPFAVYGFSKELLGEWNINRQKFISTIKARIPQAPDFDPAQNFTSTDISGSQSGIENENKADEKLYREQINNLYNSLENGNIETANRIIEIIGDSKNLLALEPLTILLGYQDETVQKNSAASLGKLGDKTATLPLIKALSNPSENVKLSAVMALGEIGDERAVKPLEDLYLSSNNPSIVNASKNAISRIIQKNADKNQNSQKSPHGQAPIIQKAIGVASSKNNSSKRWPLICGLAIVFILVMLLGSFSFIVMNPQTGSTPTQSTYIATPIPTPDFYQVSLATATPTSNNQDGQYPLPQMDTSTYPYVLTDRTTTVQNGYYLYKETWVDDGSLDNSLTDEIGISTDGSPVDLYVMDSTTFQQFTDYMNGTSELSPTSFVFQKTNIESYVASFTIYKGQTYYVVIDNTNYPDGGAYANKDVNLRYKIIY